MKIECWSIGKPHEMYIADGVKDFTKRIGNYFLMEWQLFNLRKNSASLSPGRLREEESQLILSSLKTDDWLVALDEKGKSMNSRKLASFIQDRGNDRIKR